MNMLKCPQCPHFDKADLSQQHILVLKHIISFAKIASYGLMMLVARLCDENET